MTYLNIDELLERIENGDIKLENLDSIIGNSNLASLVRRVYLERKFKTNLSGIASSIIDFEALRNHVSGTAIGSIQTPLHVIGPIRVIDGWSEGLYFIPIALLDNHNLLRANKLVEAINEEGGVRVSVDRVFFRFIVRVDEKTLLSRLWRLLGRIGSRGRCMISVKRIRVDESRLLGYSVELRPTSRVIRNIEDLSRTLSIIRDELNEGFQEILECERSYVVSINAHIPSHIIPEELRSLRHEQLSFMSSIREDELVRGFLAATGLETAKITTSRLRVSNLNDTITSFNLKGVVSYAGKDPLRIALSYPTHREVLSLLHPGEDREKMLIKLSEFTIILALVARLILLHILSKN